MKIREAFLAEVGIFFVINDTLYGWGDPIDEVATYNGFKNSDLDHYNYFYDLRAMFPEVKKVEDDYGLYPRGRVVYVEKDDKFIVYLDKCINTAKWQDKIIDEFSLPYKKVEFKHDDHYTCPGCQPQEQIHEARSSALRRMIQDDFGSRSISKNTSAGTVYHDEVGPYKRAVKFYFHPDYTEMYSVITEDKTPVVVYESKMPTSRNDSMVLSMFKFIDKQTASHALAIEDFCKELEQEGWTKKSGTTYTKGSNSIYSMSVGGRLLVNLNGKKKEVKSFAEVMDEVKSVKETLYMSDNITPQGWHIVIHESDTFKRIQYNDLCGMATATVPKKDLLESKVITIEEAMNAMTFFKGLQQGKIIEVAPLPVSVIEALKAVTQDEHIREWLSITGSRTKLGRVQEINGYESLVGDFIEYLIKNRKIKPSEKAAVMKYLKS